MSRTSDFGKKPSQSTTSINPTTSFLQTRAFAPLQPDLHEEAQTQSGYSENILGKLINQRTTESSDTPIQPKPINRLKAIATERMAIQAKLSIGEPNDKYEKEADDTASKVVQQINSPTQDNFVQREESMEEEEDELQMQPISTIQRKESMEEENEELQMKSLVQRRENLGGGEASTDLESSIQSVRGRGQSLDTSLQAKMGQAMGTDFSSVKVHTDSQSDKLNKSIQAKAFTTGQDVFFRQGAYDPSSRGGQELIAHELTHVVQQNPDRSSNTIQRLMETDRFNEITTLDTDSGFSSLFSAGRNKIKIVDEALSAYHDSQGLDKIEKLKAVIKACEDYLAKDDTAKRKDGVKRLLSESKQELEQQQRDPYLELRGVSTNYDTEQTVQRPDLVGAVTGMASFIKKMYEMRERLDVLDPTDAPGLLDVKNMLLGTDFEQMKPTIDPMDKDATRNFINTRHQVMLEKCQLQEIVVNEQGDLDPGALSTRLVEYDKTPEAQNKTLVSISGGTLTRSGTHDTAPGAAVDTTGSVTQHTGKGWEIFVMSPSGDLHMASHKIGKYHHSSLLGGGATAAAGTIKASGGKITQMNDKSGHYRPTKAQTIQACHMLAKKGVDLSTVQLVAAGFNGLANAFLTAGETNQLEFEMTSKTLIHFMNIKGIPAVQTAFTEEGWEMRNQAGRWHIYKDTGVEANHEEVRSLLHMKFLGETTAPTQKRFNPSAGWNGADENF